MAPQVELDLHAKRADLRRLNRSGTGLCRCEREHGGQTESMKEERRLVWRVLRCWKEIADGGRFPRCEDVTAWMQEEDGANCLLIAVEWPIELSHFVVVGVNLAVAP